MGLPPPVDEDQFHPECLQRRYRVEHSPRRRGDFHGAAAEFDHECAAFQRPDAIRDFQQGL